MKKLVFIIFLFLPSFAVAQITTQAEADTVYLIETRTTVRNILNDPDSTSGNYRWSNTVLDNFINESLREIASSGAIEKLDTIVTVLNTFKYSLNPDCIGVAGVLKKAQTRWVALNYRPLRSEDGTIALFGKSPSQTILSDYYVSDKYLCLDPLGSGDDSLLIFYYAFANNVTDTTGTGASVVDSIIINVPYQYQTAVVQGAVNRALASNRETAK